MMLRRSALPLIALVALVACETKVTQQAPPGSVDIAVFDPTNSLLPLPNDLALASIPTAALANCGAITSAQGQFLCNMKRAGGFPNDQEVPITIDFERDVIDAATATVSRIPAPIDYATIRFQNAAGTVASPTAVLIRTDAGGPGIVALDTIAASDLANSADGLRKTLTLHNPKDSSGSRRWPAGSKYILAIRGGANGVKTTAADGARPINASSTMFVLIQNAIANRDLTIPANQGLLPGTFDQKAAAGALLEPIRAGIVVPALAQVALAGFPKAETAVLMTFSVAPTAANPTVFEVDESKGSAPLPFELLRSPASGNILFNPSFQAAAAGLTTLEGFSTTAMLLAPVSFNSAATNVAATGGVDASTVNGSAVMVYKLTRDPVTKAVTSAALLNELKHQAGLALAGLGGNPATAGYVAQPTPIIYGSGNYITTGGVTCPLAGGCSPLVGLQPAVGAPISASTTIYMPPLAEDTTYAVVATNRLKDVAGRPLARSTFAKIVLDVTQPVTLPGCDYVAGVCKSILGGVDDAKATTFARMKADLAPVLAALPAGLTTADVVMAYTFKTQKITASALGLVQVPLDPRFNSQVIALTNSYSGALAGAYYGVNATAAGLTSAAIEDISEVSINTVSWLKGSQNSGAFDPARAVNEVITALVVAPNRALVTTACANTIAFPNVTCAPLVVFQHGITRARGDVLPIAANLAARGFVVVSIDGEKHGDRSYCSSDAQCCPAAICGVQGTCVIQPNLTTPVDVVSSTNSTPVPLGYCSGGYLNKRIDCALPFLSPSDGTTPIAECPVAACAPNPACLSWKGIPYVSANKLVSLNFFRTRDSMRQDIIDKSAVIKAVAPFALGTDALALHLAGKGYAVDPTRVYLASQSFGSILGTLSAAANPRISRAVFNVGGATVTDIFASKDSGFHASLLALIAPLTDTSADYLKLLQLAKWIIDPADPANFAKYVTGANGKLPSSLPGLTVPNRQVLTQIALCDKTIPNAQNQYLSAMLGFSVPAPDAGDSGPNGLVQWYIGGTQTGTQLACATTTDAVTHGFLLSPTAVTLKGQQNLAQFLVDGVSQPTTVRP